MAGEVIRDRMVASLRDMAASLGSAADGTQWHLFGSVARGDPNPEDIDLMILCRSEGQADTLRRSMDLGAMALPIHLALLTFEEAAEVDAVRVQRSHAIFP